MRYVLTVDMNNAAFEEAPSFELGCLLRHAAQRAQNGETHGTLRDSNGNTVGRFAIEEE